MKKLLLLLFVLITINSISNEFPLTRDLTARKKPEVNFTRQKKKPSRIKFHKEKQSKRDNRKLLIIVNSELYPEINNSVDLYMQDLQDNWISSFVLTFSGNDEFTLKEVITRYYETEEISGCLLIGNLPYVFYEMLNDFDGDGISDDEDLEMFVTDLFFSDLDGNWIDEDENGIFDDHIGNIQTEIFVSRIKADNLSLLSGSEADRINQYFSRNHLFYQNPDSVPSKALAYIDDDWASFDSDIESAISVMYDDIDVISDRNETTGEDYKQNRLESDYRFIHLFAHSGPDNHTFKINDGQQNETFYNAELSEKNPTALFYNLYACRNCDFSTENNMGSIYLLGNNHALSLTGSTKKGGMLDFDDFYDEFGTGKKLGEAFQSWWLEHVDVDEIWYERSWFYGMILMGDPYLSFSSHHIQSLQGEVSGILSNSCDFYSVNAEVLVPENEQLIIEPGVKLIFTIDGKFIVEGSMQALGTESDPILWSSVNVNTYGRGIRFNQPTIQDSSIFTNCIFERQCAPSGFYYGGAINAYQINNLRISDCVFRNNYSSYGSSIAAKSSLITISDSDFLNNDSSARGCIYADSCNITIDYCFFNDNSAGYGGAISCSESKLTLKNSTLQSNSSSTKGGAVFTEESEVYISGSEFHENQTGTSGSGFYAENCDVVATDNIWQENSGENDSGVTLKECMIDLSIMSFAENVCYGFGSALALDDCIGELNRIDFRNNIMGGGGALSIMNGNINCDSLNFYQNESNGLGGGIYTSSSESSISNSIFEENNASKGAAIAAYGDSSIDCNNVVCTGNSANEGGAIYIGNGSITLSNSCLTENSAWRGGAICFNDDNNFLDDVEISQNQATYGGGIYNNSDQLQLSNCLISENMAENEGGGIFNSSNILFDSISKCNIYNNFSQVGREIKSETYVDVIVDTFTVMQPTPIYTYPLENFTFDIEHSIEVQSHHDLYVSPEGSNQNDGSDWEHALQSISYALEVIYADSMEIRSIYLDDGIYSQSETNEDFPLIFQSYINLIGSNSSVIDGEDQHRLMFCSGCENISIQNITFIDGNSNINFAPCNIKNSAISFDNCNFRGEDINFDSYINLEYSQFIFENCIFLQDDYQTSYSNYDSMLQIYNSTQGEISNCTFKDIFSILPINVGYSENLLIKNNIFTENKNRVMRISNGNVALIENTFSNNITDDEGTILVHFSTIQSRCNKFIKNQALEGGVFYIESNAEVVESASLYERNSAQRGGAIYCEGEFRTNPVARASMIDNVAYLGNEIYTSHSFDLYLDEITVENPDSYQFYPASMVTCDYLSFKYSRVQSDMYVSVNGVQDNNGITPDSPIKSLYQALCMVSPEDEVTIHVEPGCYHSEFPIILKSNVNILNSNTEEYATFSSGKKLGNIIAYDVDSVSVEGIAFRNLCHSDAIVTIEQSEIGMRRCSFSNLTDFDYVFKVNNSFAILDSIEIIHNNDLEADIFHCEESEIDISNTTMSDIQCRRNLFDTCQISINDTVIDSVYSENESYYYYYGGCFQFEYSDVNILNVDFQNISSIENTIFIDHSDGTITNCNFDNCLSCDSSGSSILFVCHTDNAFISNTSFTNNSTLSGSINRIYSSDHVSVTNCEFINNGNMEFCDILNASNSEYICISNSMFSENKSRNGGGVNLNYSNAILSNNNINNNHASNGGAIYALNSEITLEDNSISCNIADYGGGFYNRSSTITFSDVNKCSIYNNRAHLGNDFYNYYYNPISVIVDTFTVDLPTEFHAHPIEQFDFSIEHYKNSSVEQDLFVSPYGSDENDGLSEETPLRTIHQALSRLHPTDTNPLTVHLEAGIYDTTIISYPINPISNCSIVGKMNSPTILDAGGKSSVFYIENRDNVQLENLHITNGNNSYGAAINLDGNNLLVKNSKIYNNKGYTTIYIGGLSEFRCNHTTLSRNRNKYMVYAYYSDPEFVNCTVTENNSTALFRVYYSANPIIANSIIWNNFEEYVFLLDNESTITVTCSDIEGGLTNFHEDESGEIIDFGKNIFVDPLFACNEDSYELSAESPCINAGTDYFEIDGNILIDLMPEEYFASAPDMGAIESPYTAIDHEEIMEMKNVVRMYPNPFYQDLNIAYQFRSDVTSFSIDIFNIKGQKVKSISLDEKELKNSRSGTLLWGGTNRINKKIASGVYFYKIKLNSDSFKTGKLIFIK